MVQRKLEPAFFERDSRLVAVELLGARIVRRFSDGTYGVVKIVETEAYRSDDPACHAWSLPADTCPDTSPRRAALLKGDPGLAYVYLNYGVHYLLNVVTEPRGVVGAVLIRAAEPEEGLARMSELRGHPRRTVELTNGPGKLTKALAIDARFHARPIQGDELWLAEREEADERPIVASARVGISKGQHLPWRYFFRDHPFVSPSPLNREATAVVKSELLR